MTPPLRSHRRPYCSTFESEWGSGGGATATAILVIMWGVTLPLLLLSIATKCGGCCARSAFPDLFDDLKK